jgi:hypothetical protein
VSLTSLSPAPGIAPGICRAPSPRYEAPIPDYDGRAHFLCHVIGEHRFRTRRPDRATNLWPLALLSFGESWHSLHHADPTCARRGVDRGRLGPSAAVIRLFERLGRARDVRWPTPELVAACRA